MGFSNLFSLPHLLAKKRLGANFFCGLLWVTCNIWWLLRYPTTKGHEKRSSSLRIKQFKQKERDKDLLDKWLIPWLWLNEQLKDSLTNVKENNSWPWYATTIKEIYDCFHHNFQASLWAYPLRYKGVNFHITDTNTKMITNLNKMNIMNSRVPKGKTPPLLIIKKFHCEHLQQKQIIGSWLER